MQKPVASASAANNNIVLNNVRSSGKVQLYAPQYGGVLQAAIPVWKVRVVSVDESVDDIFVGRELKIK